MKTIIILIALLMFAKADAAFNVSLRIVDVEKGSCTTDRIGSSVMVVTCSPQPTVIQVIW